MKNIKNFLTEGLSWMKISSEVAEWLNCSSIKEAKDIIGAIELGFEKSINDKEKSPNVEQEKDIIEKYEQIKGYLLNIMKEMK